LHLTVFQSSNCVFSIRRLHWYRLNFSKISPPAQSVWQQGRRIFICFNDMPKRQVNTGQEAREAPIPATGLTDFQSATMTRLSALPSFPV
jgi:hypothetical protein